MSTFFLNAKGWVIKKIPVKNELQKPAGLAWRIVAQDEKFKEIFVYDPQLVEIRAIDHTQYREPPVGQTQPLVEHLARLASHGFVSALESEGQTILVRKLDSTPVKIPDQLQRNPVLQPLIAMWQSKA